MKTSYENVILRTGGVIRIFRFIALKLVKALLIQERAILLVDLRCKSCRSFSESSARSVSVFGTLRLDADGYPAKCSKLLIPALEVRRL
jgi:hypothetical protein